MEIVKHIFYNNIVTIKDETNKNNELETNKIPSKTPEQKNEKPKFSFIKKKPPSTNNIANNQNKTNNNENKHQEQNTNPSDLNKLMTVTSNPNQQNNIQKENNEIHQ